ncbi:glutamate receptor ionotropic, kainate glr-3-like isoform X2 [Adelges cooleyi]|uniref:glutamate receptor ionotropic, kainate glr-3-like isoform X2 n=1 Tax=Adelges cooleyi TaxID=133065 RepID=UPI00217F9AEA|nr:glutamate receptor ionotropic, kainate glr-3-like isoform X2 [Adelges cooleyi]
MMLLSCLTDMDGKLKVKNFHGTRIKLLTFNNSLFGNVIENKATGKIELGDGVECRIFLEISKKLNLTVKLVSTDEKDKWGTVWPNGTLTGGATKLLYHKKVDVAFGSLWIEYYRRRFVDMTDYWSYMCIKFLVIKPKPLKDKWNLLFKPFSLGLWVLLFASATLNTVTLWMIAVVQKKIGYKHVNIFTSLSSSISCIFGITLMTNNPIRSHRLGPIRHLISWWYLFVFVMTTAFSSVLYSYITSPEYSEPITSIKQMVNEGYSWGLPYPPPMPFLLKIEDPWHVMFSQKFIPERNTADRINRIMNGKYAVLTKCVKDKHFMEAQDLPPSLLNDLRTTRSCVNTYYIGFGFSKQSPYLKSTNLVIRRIVESGIIGYWLNRVFEVRLPPATFERVYEQKPLADRNGDPSPLTIHQFRAVLVGWLIGCSLSVIVFVVECKYAEKRKIVILRVT